MAGGIFDGETYLGGARCEACNAVDRSAVLRWRRFNSDEIAYEIKFERRAVALRVAAFHRRRLSRSTNWSSPPEQRRRG